MNEYNTINNKIYKLDKWNRFRNERSFVIEKYIKAKTNMMKKKVMVKYLVLYRYLHLVSYLFK